jgi:hypothetical protein
VPYHKDVSGTDDGVLKRTLYLFWDVGVFFSTTDGMKGAIFLVKVMSENSLPGPCQVGSKEEKDI